MSTWTKVFSKTHQREYWFNTSDGTKSWTEPAELAGSASAPAAGTDTSSSSSTPSSSSSSPSSSSSSSSAAAAAVDEGDPAPKRVRREEQPKPKVAVIVPFRDLHEAQKRQEHLSRFIPEMQSFLEATGSPFEILIIEQSSDGRKFNRGKLLNIGFDLARKSGCQIFVLHDVDLLPSRELATWYTSLPSAPVHIARVWDRYSGNAKYFGGVVAFSSSMFMQINGFPNNFWGWGGEDDEMYQRVVEVGLRPVAPTSGSIIDMEDMSLSTKIAFLKKNPKWKCMNKNEVLAEHKDSWRTNGMSDLTYTELKREAKGTGCVQVLVDIGLNDHWSDLVCSLEDVQHDVSVDELKRRFAIRASSNKAVSNSGSSSGSSSSSSSGGARSGGGGGGGGSASGGGESV